MRKMVKLIFLPLNLNKSNISHTKLQKKKREKSLNKLFYTRWKTTKIGGHLDKECWDQSCGMPNKLPKYRTVDVWMSDLAVNLWNNYWTEYLMRFFGELKNREVDGYL